MSVKHSRGNIEEGSQKTVQNQYPGATLSQLQTMCFPQAPCCGFIEYGPSWFPRKKWICTRWPDTVCRWDRHKHLRTPQLGAGLAIGHNLLWAAEDVLKKEIVILGKDDQATGLKDIIYCKTLCHCHAAASSHPGHSSGLYTCSEFSTQVSLEKVLRIE